MCPKTSVYKWCACLSGDFDLFSRFYTNFSWKVVNQQALFRNRFWRFSAISRKYSFYKSVYLTHHLSITNCYELNVQIKDPNLKLYLHRYWPSKRCTPTWRKMDRMRRGDSKQYQIVAKLKNDVGNILKNDPFGWCGQIPCGKLNRTSL